MSSPEVERFEVTEDDLDNEFNPNRRTFRQSKNQATYGIWADDSDEDERPGFGTRGKRKPKDFTAPVSFVSGGVKVGDKVQPKEEVDSDEDFDPATLMQQAARQQRSGSGGRSGFGGGRGARGSGSGYFKAGKDDLGGWEKHTKGIGQKLLEKMGFESGKGLGKNKQGITTPVEAVLRKGKGTIGFYGSERSKRSKEDYPVKPDSDEEAEEKFKYQLSQWKKPQLGEKRKKPKYVYKTADEIIATGGKKKTVVQSELAKVKVIDMTGREKRVLSGYHALGHRHDMPEEEASMSPTPSGKRAFDMPELLHNLDLLCDMTEEEIIRNNKKLQFEQDMIVNLKHEQEKLEAVCKQEEKQIRKVKEILDIVEMCEVRMAPGSRDPMSMEECATIFQRLQDDFYEEYKIYDLATVGVALVYPMLKKDFANWKPLLLSTQGLETMRIWRAILCETEEQFAQGESNMGPYERLVWDAWMPAIRRTIAADWSPRDSDSLILLLETWQPVLPPWILNNILEQIVLPRLQAEVENWNPLTDTMPIHAWLHPWLPLMEKRLEPLWAPIRNKLANALRNWHPSDPSAKLILQPWLQVWTGGQVDSFLVKNIVPKLGLCLQEFIINPHQQHLDAWQWTLLWVDLVPMTAFVTLLQKHFFPKWHQVLSSWLNARPNYDEVTKWYTGWKQMMPEKLMQHPGIKAEFTKALDVMNRAVSGTSMPAARENVGYMAGSDRRPPPPLPPPPPPRMPGFEGIRAGSTARTAPTSFKDLIEKKAEECGVVFMPIPNKTWEAKQVYRFGHAQLYLDRGVIFMYNQNIWSPASLDNLIRKGCGLTP